MSQDVSVLLKNALEAVPIFDGHNIPLAHFLEGCEEARNMLPADIEEFFTKVVRNKLRGEARRAIQGFKYTTIKDLGLFLKSIYPPAKTIYELQGELGRIYQSDNEGVLAYANRVKDLGSEIIDAYEISRQGQIGKYFRDSLDNDLIDCFISGLKTEIERKMTREGNFVEVMLRAISIERELQIKMSIRGKCLSRQGEFLTDTYSSSRYLYTNDCRNTHYIQRNVIICQICQRQGHSADKCWNINQGFNVEQDDFTEQPTMSSRQYTNRNSKAFLPKGPSRVNTLPTRNYSSLANSEVDSFCRYCRRAGHVIAKCQKRAYNNRLLVGQKQPDKQIPQDQSRNLRNFLREDTSRENVQASKISNMHNRVVDEEVQTSTIFPISKENEEKLNIQDSICCLPKEQAVEIAGASEIANEDMQMQKTLPIREKIVDHPLLARDKPELEQKSNRKPDVDENQPIALCVRSQLKTKPTVMARRRYIQEGYSSNENAQKCKVREDTHPDLKENTLNAPEVSKVEILGSSEKTDEFKVDRSGYDEETIPVVYDKKPENDQITAKICHTAVVVDNGTNDTDYIQTEQSEMPNSKLKYRSNLFESSMQARQFEQVWYVILAQVDKLRNRIKDGNIVEKKQMKNQHRVTEKSENNVNLEIPKNWKF